MYSVSSKQMGEVDRLAMQKYGIHIYQLMENAGRGIARFVSGMKPAPRRALVVFGKGNNGGDGLVAARHLTSYGIKTDVLGGVPASGITDTGKHQLDLLRRMGIKPLEKADYSKYDVILDCLLGYNIKGDPKYGYADIIKGINNTRKSRRALRVVSCDLPSGLDPDTGRPKDPCIRADVTLTLALPKKGLRTPPGKRMAGKLFIVNIGIQPVVYDEIGLDGKRIGRYFSKQDIIMA